VSESKLGSNFELTQTPALAIDSRLDPRFVARNVPDYLSRWYSDLCEANGGRELVGVRHILMAFGLAAEREKIPKKVFGDLLLEAVTRLDGENARNRLELWIEKNHRMSEFGLYGIWVRMPKENGHAQPETTEVPSGEPSA
jgi:hypothetical protein